MDAFTQWARSFALPNHLNIYNRHSIDDPPIHAEREKCAIAVYSRLLIDNRLLRSSNHLKLNC
ncbi:conserved hypothetical protein [Ricinus communis]|uniref:Uncharacterized protein n=1 Tax=Ricinus communis TaxID=3988 RepID=B9S169_RICCO|nr:conserved hypothetical protein [Ricinus communis]